MKRRLKIEKGYTLVEALMIVVIVAILASIGIARFIGARENTARSVCLAQQSRLNAAYKKWQVNNPNTTFTNSDGDMSLSTDGDHDVWVDAGSPVCPDGGIFLFILNPDAPGGVIEYKAQCSIAEHNH